MGRVGRAEQVFKFTQQGVYSHAVVAQVRRYELTVYKQTFKERKKLFDKEKRSHTDVAGVSTKNGT